MNAYLFLAGRRRERDLAQLLGVMAMAKSEDPDPINKQIQKWEQDQ